MARGRADTAEKAIVRIHGGTPGRFRSYNFCSSAVRSSIRRFTSTASASRRLRPGTARLPWFAVVFGGRHLFKLYALDQNWFDYTRSSFEGGEAFEGGLAGDNFERPLFSIDGGLGLFGSASVDSVGFFVLPRLNR